MDPYDTGLPVFAIAALIGLPPRESATRIRSQA